MLSWPEDEDEENKKSAEGGDAIHRLQHDNQLVLKRWHESHQLKDAQQTESAQNGQTAGALLCQFHNAVRIHNCIYHVA